MAYLDGPRPRIFAHRGASATHPENTIEAFAAGLAAGADRLELDVHATADGRIVVLHDEDLSRTCGEGGIVAARSWAEVRELDAGHEFVDASGAAPFRGQGLRIPSLDEVLDTFPDVPLNIEIKPHDPAIEEEVATILTRYDARDRVLLAAFDHRILERIRRVAPDVVTSLSAQEVTEFVMRLLAGDLAGYRSPGVAFQVPPSHEGIEIVTEGFVDAAHRLGMEVHVWTINDETDIHRLLDLGVDGIMSDDPALVRAVFERRGLRP